MSVIHYNQNLKKKARELRKNMTKGEILLWQKINNRQLKNYKFIRQKPIANFIVDFFCKELMLIIEIDGISHYGKEEYDKKRENFLKEKGFFLLRFREREIYTNIDDVVRSIVNF